MTARFESDGPVDAIGPEAEAALLRVAQEALHNAEKYAQAGQITLRLAVQGGLAELTVADDGVGFDPAAPARPDGVTGGGAGLASMAERVRALGGTLDVHSAPGNGCTVTARVPAK